LELIRRFVLSELIRIDSFRFYRAMHFSAKRGIAIACRLSVCPSVCLRTRIEPGKLTRIGPSQ